MINIIYHYKRCIVVVDNKGTHKNLVNSQTFDKYEKMAASDSDFYRRFNLLGMQLCNYCHSYYHKRNLRFRERL